MGIIIGSARSDENGKYTGGKPGDQKQTSTTNDTRGEVSMQGMYMHAKGWHTIRPVVPTVADKLAERCVTACNNGNIGYDQVGRYGIISKGIDTKEPTEADCSSLIREEVKEATGIDPGDFTTANERSKLLAMKDAKGNKIFEDAGEYISQEKTPVYNGDILVTKTKGHTVTVCGGNQRTTASGYYPKYKGSSSSIVVALIAVGEKDTSKAHRTKLAKANGIVNYSYTAKQNSKMVSLLKKGRLKRA